MVFNSVAPLFAVAYAEEINNPTPTVEQTSTENSPTPEPTIDQSQPTETIAPTTTPDQTTPTETVTPAPDQTTITPTPENTTGVTVTPTPANDLSPPANNNSNPTDNPTITPVVSPTPTITPEPATGNEEISAVILKNVAAPSIDLESVEESGSAVLTTDKPDYAPTDTALITGSKLNPNTIYSLTISSSDNPATSTTVDVTSDENGVFAYAYQLDGKYRPNYKVELRDQAGNTVATTSFTDSNSTANPALPSSCCGLDIALVIDNSNSIDSTELSQMKTALKGFVNALAGTPTQFSVTRFGTNASVLQSFTSDTTLINSAIDSVSTGGGGTDWQKGIIAARGTFDPRADKPNLMIFASDGNPTYPDCGGATTCAADVAHAVDEANIAKSTPLNIRMLALGIGGDLDTNNLIAISGPVVNGTDISTTDVITTDFSGMAAKLATFAATTCGGTITVKKYIDTISESTKGGTGWTYNVTGSSYSSNLTTDSTGQANTGKVTTGTGYSITETNMLPGYSYGSAICTKQGGTTVGSAITNGWGSIPVGNNDIITCNFVNYLNKTDLSIIKTNSPDPINNGGTLTYTLTVNNLTTIPALSTVVTDALPAGFSVTSVTPSVGNCSNKTAPSIQCELGTLAANASATVVIVGTVSTTATSIRNTAAVTTTTPETSTANNSAFADTTINQSGTIKVHKDVQGPNGESVTDTAPTFKVELDGTNEQSIQDGTTATYNNVASGSHTITESVASSDYSLYGISATAGQVGTPSGLSVNVSGGQTVDVYVTNRQKQAHITVVKVVRDAAGNVTSDHQKFTVQLNNANDDANLADNNTVTYNMNPGGPFAITEISNGNYDNQGCKLSNGGDASGITLISNQSVTVTCTNKQKAGAISGYKYKADGATGIVGWTINLYKCVSSGADCNQIATTLTDATGLYNFTNLVTGFYQVREYLDSLFTPVGSTSHDVTITPNTTSTGNNFKNFKNISITVCKKADADGNLTTSTDQSLVSDWGMTLYSDGTKVGETQTTGTDGCYTWTNLGPNHAYRADEENRTGWTPLSDVNYTYAFGAAVDGVNQSHTFVNAQKGTITVKKDIRKPDGTDTSDSQNFTVQLNSGNNQSISEISSYTYTVEAGSINTVAEIADANYDNKGCKLDSGTTATNFAVPGGQNINVTCTNWQKKARVNVGKAIYQPDGTTLDTSDGTQFTITLSDGQSHQIMQAAGSWIFSVDPGTYSVTETPNSNYVLMGYSPTSVTVGSNGYATILVNNKHAAATLTVVKDVKAPDGTTDVSDTHSFSVQLTGIANSTQTFYEGHNATYSVNAGTTYSVKETADSNYDYVSCTPDQDGNPANGAQVSATVGQNLTVTCVNKQKTGTITVYKNVVAPDGITSVNDSTSFPITINGITKSVSESTSQTYTVNPGTYSETENLTGIPYDFVKDTGSATITSGGTGSITVTNKQRYGSISGMKFNDLNGNGTKDVGEPGLAGWTIQLDKSPFGSVDTITTTDTNGNYSFDNLISATYRVREVGKTGWTQTSADPSDITIASGTLRSNVNFGNQGRGTITIAKNTISGDDTFNFTAAGVSSFNIPTTAGTGSKVFSNIAAGTYTFNEDVKAGWVIPPAADSIVCTGASASSTWGLNSSPHATIVLGAGDNVQCTFKNGKIPTVKIIKNVIGTGNPGDFTISLLDGSRTNLPNSPFHGSTTGTTFTLDNLTYPLPATFIVYEAAVPGYTTTFSGDCARGTNPTDGNMSVNYGDNKVCTITNVRDTGIITIKKTLSPTNDSGKFNLQINGATVGTGANVSNNGTTGAITEDTGTYTVGETEGTATSLTNYNSSISCDNGQSGSGSSLSVNVNKGSNVTCTISNARKTAALKLVKVVDYGPAQPNDWTLSASGTNGFNDVGNSTTFHTVNANSPYTLSESSISGWSQFGSWSCDKGNLSGNTITLSADQNTTCTITNHRDMGSAKVNKKTDINGDGDWNDTNEGNNQTDANNWANANGFAWLVDGVNYAFGATTPNNLQTTMSNIWHNFDETIPAGYHFVGWYKNAEAGRSCTNPNGTTLPINNGEIQITKDNTTEITYCNAHDTGTLKVLKNVDLNGDGDYTDAGETGATDWNWQIDGGSDHNTGASSITLPTGNYQITETQKTNFHVTGFSCTGGTADGSLVTISKGANVICTFTNARDTGKVTVNKVLSPNTNSGTFNLNINSTTYATGGNGTTTGAKTFITGNVTVSETGANVTNLNDYTSTYSCNNDKNGTGTSVTFNLSSDQNVVCTFTNTRKTGSLKVNKLLDNDGNGSFETSNPVIFNWSLDGNGSNTMGGLPITNITTGSHSVSENSATNYHYVGWYMTDAKDNHNHSYSCTNLQGTNLPISISINYNQTADITLCNARDTGTIKIVKETKGGEGTFNFTIVGNDKTTPESITTHSGSGRTDEITLTTGTYSASEAAKEGWTLTDASCKRDNHRSFDPKNINLGKNEDIVCTFENTKLGKVVITKYEDSNADGNKDSNEQVLSGWTINLSDASQTTNGNGQAVFNNLPLGNYNLSENLQAGWTQSNIACDNDEHDNWDHDWFNFHNWYDNYRFDNSNRHSIKIGAGDVVYCKIGNYQKPHIIVEKDVVSSQGNPLEDKSGSSFSFTITKYQTTLASFNLSDGQSQDTQVKPGSYNINENNTPANYQFAGCQIASGENENPELFNKLNASFIQEGENENNNGNNNQNNGTSVTVKSGDSIRVICKNKLMLPKLTISKKNDAVGNKSPNDTVGFTITIGNDENAGQADNVTVTDLLAKGFAFNSGSWKVVSSDTSRGVSGDISSLLTAPAYHSPGTWTLGTLKTGETLTLTYTANIDSGEQTGIYKDVAWGQGYQEGDSSSSILAAALPEGFVDTNFVGTQVAIARGGQGGPVYNAATTTQAVLGASTSELPSTGENTLWVIIAALMFTLGAGTLISGLKLKKKYE